MPPRPPPTPGVLTTLCCVVAALAVWGGVTLEARLPGSPCGCLGGAVVRYGLVRVLRAGGWRKGLTLVSLIVALVWLPAALLAAALPRGAGPVGGLYARLGAPMAGRWTA